MRSATYQLLLNRRTIVKLLWAIASVIILASIASQVIRFGVESGYLKKLVFLFYVDNEANIPTFFSALLLLVAAQLLFVIGAVNAQESNPYTSKWLILSLGFLFMALDEACRLHERSIDPLRSWLGGGKLGIFHYAWVIPGIAIVIVAAIFFISFLQHLPKSVRRRFLMAAILYLTGALGCEAIGGAYAELHGVSNPIYSVIVTVEESLEMAGVITLIEALLVYLSNKEVLVSFGGNRGRKHV